MTALPTGPGFGPTALVTPANALTLARLGSTLPFLWWLHREPVGWGVWAAWAVLCTTDLFDGVLARRHGRTRSGAFLDPLADKVLVLGGMSTLVVAGSLWWVPVAIIAAREVAMSVYRTYVGRRGVSIPANRPAKVKTWMQCVAAGIAMIPPAAEHPLLVGTFVWAAVALTIATGVQYAVEGRRLLAELPAPAPAA